MKFAGRNYEVCCVVLTQRNDMFAMLSGTTTTITKN